MYRLYICTLSFVVFFKFGTGQLAQQLRVLAYLAEDSSLASKRPSQDHSSLRPEAMDGSTYTHTE